MTAAGKPEARTELLDPRLRRIVTTGEAAFRSYDRYGQAIPGLTWLPLSPDSDADGGGCFMLRFAPGARSLPHEHSEIEEFMVLEGELEDCDGHVLKAGDFVSYAAGSRHASQSPNGCLILVFLRRGNRLLPGADG